MVSQRVVFFGTPEWAVPSLTALLEEGFDVCGVVTNPDRPAGRGYEIQASPVKEAALGHGLPVWQPTKARDPEFHSHLFDLAPDVCVVVAYGKILPQSLLEVPKRGFINVHFSLLPEYRGAAPVQRAVMEGSDTTGVSIMVLTEGMDEGPVLARRAETIRADDTAGSVGGRLATIGADLLAKTLQGYLVNEIHPVEQDHAAATYAVKISTEEARIDWTETAIAIRDKVRGLHPAPGAWTSLGDQRMKVHAATVAEGVSMAPGALQLTAEGLMAGTGNGGLLLDEAQLAGKRRMPGAEIGRGLRLTGDEVLGR